jgi:hypothetical protein
MGWEGVDCLRTEFIRGLLCHSSGCSCFVTAFRDWLSKVKESPNRPGVVQRIPGGLGSQISWHSAREGGEVSLTHRPPLPPGMFLVVIFTRGWFDPRAMERSKGDMSLKIPVTPPGIDPGTVRLVAQRLNHYATPGPDWLGNLAFGGSSALWFRVTPFLQPTLACNRSTFYVCCRHCVWRSPSPCNIWPWLKGCTLRNLASVTLEETLTSLVPL